MVPDHGAEQGLRQRRLSNLDARSRALEADAAGTAHRDPLVALVWTAMTTPLLRGSTSSTRGAAARQGPHSASLQHPPPRRLAPGTPQSQRRGGEVECAGAQRVLDGHGRLL